MERECRRRESNHIPGVTRPSLSRPLWRLHFAFLISMSDGIDGRSSPRRGRPAAEPRDGLREAPLAKAKLLHYIFGVCSDLPARTVETQSV